MGKIKHIEVSNFKSIKHLEINDCNKINVFIGKPNAGKSNVLEALGLFGIFMENRQDQIKDFVRFRKVTELFFEENSSEIMSVKINESSLDVASFDFVDRANKTFKGFNDGLKFSHNIKNSTWDLDEKLSNIKKYNFLLPFFRDGSNKIILDYPKGENLVQVIVSNPKIRKRVNELFVENNLKLLIEKTTNELKIFKEYQDGTFFTLSYELIADTLQRLIFYKAAIMSNENSVLLFEEPEAHCFEPYILELTNDIKYDENDNQFFIVTHSDFIVKEFLRDEESKENPNIYLVNNEDGETKVKLLDKNKNEDVFEYGMNIFFNFESLWESN